MDRADGTIIPPDTWWLTDAAAQKLCRAIEAGGHKIYFVGGCVRDALLGRFGGDVDLSTDALPEQVITLASAAGLKSVPTGIAHGTVTVVADGTPFEITTFRRDVETDGRRAVVAFSDNITDDARRRDFTMNALYADVQGRLIDPLEGLPDLLARRVVFIEDASARIREDYLRILRYFRFSALFTAPDQGYDPEVLAAISANIDGLETLSADRIGLEIRKLLAAPDPAPTLAVMRQIGVLPAILPASDDRWISVLVHMETLAGVQPDWICRLAGLGGEDVVSRMRLSRADASALEKIRGAALGSQKIAEIAYRHSGHIAEQALVLRAALTETQPDPLGLETIKSATEAQFPIRATDLMPQFTGPALGARLALLEQRWIDSSFTLSRDALLATP
ncbi:poly(A) polymerase [Sulfitobacter brevis]|uniref:Poly(A) polymerase n=1 Tax=Sulfitobacter brevis TaxID=74348 RepID=A0A1I1Y6L8_9RHOB|nr:CCA tRNA nucleotidyltransferase [Sulfitobacter brevis]SFE15285.1 poly(A) polymerase [Sulfitobacter brevis]